MQILCGSIKRQTTILRFNVQMTNLRLEPTFEPIHLSHATYGSHPSKFMWFSSLFQQTCSKSCKSELRQTFVQTKSKFINLFFLSCFFFPNYGKGWMHMFATNLTKKIYSSEGFLVSTIKKDQISRNYLIRVYWKITMVN
jgi:hypothetical protein